ncbi:MAG: TolB family protein [Bacillota bacterium]
MRTKSWLSLLLVLGLLLSACTKPAAERPAPTPDSSGAPTAPDKTPGGSQPPADSPKPVPDLTLPLKASTNGLMVRLTLKPGEEPQANGLYFVDTATGEIEGWTAAHAEGISFSAVAGSQRWVVARAPVDTYLVDRQSQKVWQWNAKELAVVAASDDLLLFELLGPDPGSRFVVVNAALEPLSVFSGAEGPLHSQSQARFAPDGRKLVHLGHDGALRLVDVATGKTEPLATDLPQREGFHPVASLRLSRDGSEIQVAVTHYPTGQWRPDLSSDLLRFTWNGKAAAAPLTVPGTSPSLSPDGKLVAYESAFQGKVPTVVIADAASGEPQAWTRSGALCYQDQGTIGGRWLADGSGVLLRTYGDQFQLMTLDGRLRTNPVWGAQGAEPLPAPDNPSLLALRDRSLVDLSGKVLLPGAESDNRFGDLDPWGADSSEMLLTLPHLGHGGRCGNLILLPPKAESAASAQYDAPMHLQVNTPGECLTLRAEPNGKAIKCLPHGTKLTVTPDRQPVPLLMMEQPLVGGHYWIHVQAPEGLSGWVAITGGFLTWAER